MSVVNSFNAPKVIKMEPKTMMIGTFLGTAKTPFFDRENSKTIWFNHHMIKLENGGTDMLVHLRGDKFLDRLMEDLHPIAQAMGGIEVCVAYAGTAKKRSAQGREYTQHRWSVGTALPWAELPPKDDYSDYGKPGYEDDIPF